MLDNQYFYIGLIVVEAIVIIALLVANIKTKKRNKNFKEMLSWYKKSVREEQLDAKLQNQYHTVDKSLNDSGVVPYQVEFNEDFKVEKIDAICVHLTYKGNYYTKKYVVNILDEAYLGSDKTNKICIDDEGIDSKHIRFIKQGRELYVHSISSSFKTGLLRGKKKHSLSEAPVRVNDGDVLEFKDSTLEIGFI